MSISEHCPTYYPGVPAMHVAINNHPDTAKYDLGSIKGCCSGAAPLPAEVQQRFQELTGARLAEGYDLSEASPVTHGTIGILWLDTEDIISFCRENLAPYTSPQIRRVSPRTTQDPGGQGPAPCAGGGGIGIRCLSSG